LISWTKYLHKTGECLNAKLPSWEDKVKIAGSILKEGDDIAKRMEVVGQEGTSLDDFIIYLKSELYEISYLQQNAFDKIDTYCPIDRQIEMFKLIQDIFDTKFKIQTHDQARDYFLDLQNMLKNMNYMEFNSDEYKKRLFEMREKISSETNKE
jgi:V/A-type H+-transporting ATPase subunit A